MSTDSPTEGSANQPGDEGEVSRIRSLMSEALASRLLHVLGGSDIEHSAYSLQYIADEVLDAALSAASAEGQTLQKRA